MVRTITRALIAVLVLGGCSGSGIGTAPTIGIGAIEVTSVPCSPCTGDRCLPCRGPSYSLTASVTISNSRDEVVAVRTANGELRQNGTITTGGAEAPSVGSGVSWPAAAELAVPTRETRGRVTTPCT